MELHSFRRLREIEISNFSELFIVTIKYSYWVIHHNICSLCYIVGISALYLLGAFVHDVQFIDIPLAHLQSLSHLLLGALFEGDNGHFAVLGEAVG